MVLALAGLLRASARWETGAVLVVLLVLFNSGGFERELGLPRDLLVYVEEGLFLALLISSVSRLRVIRPWQFWLLAFSGFVVLTALTDGLPLFITAPALRLALFPLGALIVGATWRQGSPVYAATAVVLCSAPAALLGARQALTGFTPAELSALQSAEATYIVGDTYRLVGASGTGQEFAMLMVLVALSGLWLRLASDGWRAQVGAVAMVVASALVALSLQRLALAALIVGAMVIVTKTTRGRSWRRGVVQTTLVVLAGALAVVALAPARVQDASARLGTLTTVGSDDSFLTRLTTVWPEAWHLIAARPLIGWGAGSAGVLTVRYPWEFPNGTVVADSMFLHLGVQVGLIGVLLFGMTVYRLWRGLRGSGAVLAKAVILAMGVAGVVGTVLGLYAFMLVACLVLGVCTQTPERSASGPPIRRVREGTACG